MQWFVVGKGRTLLFLGGVSADSWMKSSQRTFRVGRLHGARKICLHDFQKKSLLFGGSLLIHGGVSAYFLGKQGGLGAILLPEVLKLGIYISIADFI